MSGELAGPLQRVRFNGVTEYHDLPRNTLDPRYEACPAHHLACDCREALLAEETGEYRAMYRELEQAILAATEGHQTYAFDEFGDEDEFAQCKCPACGIARAAFVGFSETMRQREEAAARQSAEAARRYRGAHHINLKEVPF